MIRHSFRLSMHLTNRPHRPSDPYTAEQGMGRLIGLYHRPHLGHFAQDPDL